VSVVGLIGFATTLDLNNLSIAPSGVSMTARASAPAADTISRKSPADCVSKAPVDAFFCGRFAD